MAVEVVNQQISLLKSKKILPAAIVILAVLAVVGGVWAYAGVQRNSPKNQLSLGQKFLEELDYDNAILTFNKIIEVEPMNVQAYRGLAEAYVGKGDTAAAIETLQKGFDATGDAEIKARLAVMTEELKMQAAQQQTDSLLKPLAVLFAANDLEGARALMRTQPYVDLSAQLGDDPKESFYCGETDVEGTRAGKGIAVYPEDWFYYGDYKNDLREGHGVWMWANSPLEDNSYLIYEGTWVNDLPNGQGKDISKQPDNWPDESVAGEIETWSGIFVNGLCDGAIELVATGSKKHPEDVSQMQLQAVNGILQEITDARISTDTRTELWKERGQVVVGCDDNMFIAAPPDNWQAIGGLGLEKPE